jgi:hypothetical protein
MMFSRARRRFAVLTGFLWPCKEARKVIGTIHRSKRFDMAFYRASNPGMRWIFRLAPLRHYVTIGESRGLCPAPWFSPVAYRRGHIVRSDSAFLDYLHRAEPIAVPQKDEPPDLSGWTQARARAPYAVVLHLYYPELWPEIRRDLSGARIDFDLFVSLSGAAATPGGVAEDILASFPDARIAKVPNRGRDMLPFVLAANSGALSTYRAVAKIHGKLSPHLSDGARWRRRLIAGVFPPDCAERLAAFNALAPARLWVAEGAAPYGNEWWGSNLERASEIFDQALPEHLKFPAGGIFWAKPAVLSRLASLGLDSSDFEAEAGFVDGTTAHAVERLIGVLAVEGGGRIVDTRDLGGRTDGTCPSRPKTGRGAFMLLTG